MSGQPWEIPNSPWKDEKAYYNWLRGSVRRIWSRHPVKISYKQQRRYKAPVGRNGKGVWVSDCEMCGEQSRSCDVDHLHGGYGFTDWQSFTEWAKMILWVTYEDIRELCPECHAVVTLSQRLGISIEEARLVKEVIAMEKDKTLKKFLDDHGVVCKATERREKALEILKKKGDK